MIVTRLKLATLSVLFLSSVASNAATSMLRQASEQEVEEVPPGLVNVKMLPPELDEQQSVDVEKPADKISDKRHPDYVRCRVEPVAGSIIKHRRVCMTNRNWKLAIRLGNKYASDFVADNQPGFFP
ncbi:hypothetical protein [Parasphingorhabdus sp.]|uniref:hypothetical protein n=1 Tax=Parasphingorhabdus sp. TaxID=2709688 RepID=UPI003BAE9B56